MQNNHWTKMTGETNKRNRYRNKTNRKQKKKSKVLFFFLFCEVINTRGRIKVVQLNISEQFVLSIHAAHDFHRRQRVFLKCFLETKEVEEEVEEKQQSKAFHDDDDDDIHIQRFGTDSTRWRPIKFEHYRPAGGRGEKSNEKLLTELRKQRYTAWRTQATDVYYKRIRYWNQIIPEIHHWKEGTSSAFVQHLLSKWAERPRSVSLPVTGRSVQEQGFKLAERAAVRFLC